jgi:hypothetical protein
MEKSEKTAQIIDLLQGLPFRDRIEILANVFIRLGLLAIEYQDSEIVPEHLDSSGLFSLAAKYKKQYGETLQGAILVQGITLLMWLQKEK